MLNERFTSDELDRSVWVPWYLPHWSSRATSAATCEIAVFDFPDRAHLVDGAVPVPELVVPHVTGRVKG